MKKALLSMHLKSYNSTFASAKKGNTVKYHTNRKAIIDELVLGDVLYIRLMNDISNPIKAVCEYKGKGDGFINIKVIKKYKFWRISARKIHKKYNVKVCAEHGWLKS